MASLPKTHDEWKRRYQQLRDIADRIARMRFDRAKKAWNEAPGGPREWCGCSVHNASISETGNGWGAGPNGRAIIKAAKLASHIHNTMYDGLRIVTHWDDRVRPLGGVA